ncbi:MAG: HEAT repeat domain-containing protein [Planctomycetales bacterium]|nr:HEAT repeat domain-containing protein [Planctomycetales bacterium]
MGATGSGALLREVASDSSDDLGVRVYATIAIGVLRDASLAPALEGLLSGSPDPELRMAAAIAIGEIGEASSVAILARLAASPTEEGSLRAAAVLALGRAPRDPSDEVSCLDLLCRALLTDRDNDVRRTAARILRRWPGHPRAVEALAKSARRDTDEPTRAYAMLSLAEVIPEGIASDHGREAREVLQKALAHPGSVEFGFGALALGLLGRRDSACAVPLRMALDSVRDPHDRSACALALGLMRDPASRERLSAIVSEAGADADLRGWSCVALALLGGSDSGTSGLLCRSFENAPELDVRAAGAFALGILGDRSTIPSLRNGMKAENRYERLSAMCSLSYFRDPDTVREFLDFYKREANGVSRETVLRALRVLSCGGEWPVIAEIARDLDPLLTWSRYPTLRWLFRLD